MTKTVSVVGLGKLGAPLAACLASKGLRVVGVDTDPRKVEMLNRGHAPVYEPRLEEFIQASKGLLSATGNIEEAVLASEVTFVVVATPSEPQGGFSLRYVLPVCEAIGRALSAKQDFHLVVLTSTVMPGSTGGPVRSALEQTSSKSAGRDFGLCYSPEFIALGSVIHDFLNPDFVLIGESDPRSGAMLEALYKEVCENLPAAARMSFINAEITKLSLNSYVTSKISFANMLARICERLPGASVDAVTAAIGLDSRVGTKYLKGALSYGGPCFPRDNVALATLARQVGAPADLAQGTDQFNRSQIGWLAGLVQDYLQEGETAGILGLTYKPYTDVVEEAAGLLLALELALRGVPIVAYDPAGNANAALALGQEVRLAATPQECIEQAAVVVLATPWPEFAHIPPAQWATGSRNRTVIDCWRVLKHLDHHESLRYIPLGTGDMLIKSSHSVGRQILVGR
jgi:UDPglucose 6-dehydrogenase